MHSISYVGLDVHKTMIAVAMADAGRSGEVRQLGAFANRTDVLRTAVVWPERRARLPRREAPHRDACIHDGARGQAVQEEQKGGAKLYYIGNVVTENRNGFRGRGGTVTGVGHGRARGGDIVRHSPGAQRITVGGDKAFDTADPGSSRPNVRCASRHGYFANARDAAKRVDQVRQGRHRPR